MSEIELKACPFCGAKPVMRVRDGDERNGYNTNLTLDCLCGASIETETHNTGGLPTETPAAAKRRLRARWNTRAPQWQPIESAPKTTRSILVWCPERQNQYMVSWDGRYEGEWRTVGGGTVLTESPTHWQPLPAPPEVEG